ncbi:hypothetical protein ACTPOK_41095 [Streptomyces inhibens]|uniref:hypothetical protein n=1 Tax=Streptomyces inhibens TaxID=2293571 RepID=UPI00402A8A2A
MPDTLSYATVPLEGVVRTRHLDAPCLGRYPQAEALAAAAAPGRRPEITPVTPAITGCVGPLPPRIAGVRRQI